jgi:hypothetical protein
MVAEAEAEEQSEIELLTEIRDALVSRPGTPGT